jgi:transcriptional regulator with XRE-family HTH domain
MNGRARIAWNLRQIRTERGLSQERLADEAAVDPKYVGMLEREEIGATVDKLDQLAEALGVDVSAFFVQPQKGAEKPKPLRAGRRPR